MDNTQDEDWKNVSLTLVAGLPISFIHDLYSPRYKKRPVVQVKEEEAYAPPILEEAMLEEAAFDDFLGAEAPMEMAKAMPASAPAPSFGAARVMKQERRMKLDRARAVSTIVCMCMGGPP